MNVADQLPKIYILIADDRMVTILKEISVSKVAKVLSHSVTREETPQEFRKTQGATAQEEMSVIGQ